jgi:hypothetical protein
LGESASRRILGSPRPRIFPAALGAAVVDDEDLEVF